MKPYTELEWRKQLYTLRYTLRLDFARNDLEYLRYLVPYIEKFAENYAEGYVNRRKEQGILAVKKDAYDNYPLFKLTGVYALTMRAGIQYFEEGLEQVKINADYRRISSGVTTIGQRGKWELNEQEWMTEKELDEFYDRPEGIAKGMDSALFDRTIGGIWQNTDGLLARNSDGNFYNYTIKLPDNLLPLPYKGMSVATGKLCPHRGEWITLGRDQEAQLIEEGATMPQSHKRDVIWELKTPWSTIANKASKYPIGYRVMVEDIDNPPESPISGIWKAVGHDYVSLQFFNIKFPMYAPAVTIEIFEPKPFQFATEKTKRTSGEWELIYII